MVVTDCQGTLGGAACSHTCADGFEGGSVVCWRHPVDDMWSWRVEPCRDIDSCAPALASDPGVCGTDASGTTITASCSDIPAAESGGYRCTCDKSAGYRGESTVDGPAHCTKEDDFAEVMAASLIIGAVVIITAVCVGLMCLLRAPHHKRKNAENDLVGIGESQF